MLNNTHLRWVAENRRTRVRTQHVVKAAEIAMGRMVRKGTGRSPQIDEIINGIVDPEFRRDCTLGGLANRALTVYVNDERLICHYRMRWSFELHEALRSCGVRSVRFCPGNAPDQKSGSSENFARMGS